MTSHMTLSVSLLNMVCENTLTKFGQLQHKIISPSRFLLIIQISNVLNQPYIVHICLFILIFLVIIGYYFSTITLKLIKGHRWIKTGLKAHHKIMHNIVFL